MRCVRVTDKSVFTFHGISSDLTQLQTSFGHSQVGWDPHVFQAVKVKVILTMKFVMKRQIGGGIRKTLNPSRNNI
ncbi:hypothetical protein C0J52_16591 [Blattella germanica]|nr:hypothetical protein C0J52_16591 [Blattella germanica]